LKLVQCQQWESVGLVLEGLRYFKISEGGDLGGSFVDEISVTYLPQLDHP
jgi:hypothetical protein